MPKPYDPSRVANLGYPILTDKRTELVRMFQDAGVECRPLISGNMGIQPMYVKEYGRKIMPNATVVDNYGMYIPNHAELTTDDIDRISKIINSLV
jgi:CDP-6-deoxy-D-xylo-4-hexulose-3-dehydrase